MHNNDHVSIHMKLQLDFVQFLGGNLGELTDEILNHKNEFDSYQSNTHINQVGTVHTFS